MYDRMTSTIEMCENNTGIFMSFMIAKSKRQIFFTLTAIQLKFKYHVFSFLKYPTNFDKSTKLELITKRRLRSHFYTEKIAHFFCT